MKLAAQYNKATLIITLIVLCSTAFVYYGAINYIVNKQLDHDLTEEVEEIADYIKLNQHLPAELDFEGDQTSFIKTDQKIAGMIFYDMPYHKNHGNKTESGRAVKTIVTLKGVNYVAIVAQSKEASENLTQLIICITVLLTAVLLLILALTNRYIFGGLWKPFYHVLAQLKAFNVADSDAISPNTTNIDEFKELNDAVTAMSARVKTDYENLKTFTENASHEMLTPIAVITSKLDTLIQDEKLKAEQFAQINDIYAATNKLSRLNQSLLLLVKIENDLINDTADFNLKNIILEKEHQLQELAQNKGIELIHILEDKEITANKYLIEILINNLFNNAIKHSEANGKLYIRLTTRELIFQNTGESALNGDEIFERFKKGHNSDGTGLGLTIAKNICNQHGYHLSYHFKAPYHTFKITF
ncbi:HAMP domain-containing sensor histidine kinase [Mucilaginibacter sp. UR6-11]|uniref:sensor histidine kinase n=1 Tax=Mucilaginibacter sp. UR6-11 TaxID=1435644 RepID=UPI001E29DB9E|nr:HAMP domain-containing sensor histidine kinase [Mucilaginibacter sp. UR6-11]MCC8423811.1 HAMP domain-containing histidine kinase [Mucilaginibacter sp. UR6-11]